MHHNLKEALEIVKAQAKVRIMNEDEIISMTQSLAKGIRAIFNETTSVYEVNPVQMRESINELPVVCLECGNSFKIQR